VGEGSSAGEIAPGVTAPSEGRNEVLGDVFRVAGQCLFGGGSLSHQWHFPLR